MEQIELTPKQKSDLDTLYKVSEQIAECYDVLNRIAVANNFPSTNKAAFFSDCTDLSANLFLLCNWIIKPSAETLLPFIQNKHNHAFAVLVNHLNGDKEK